METVQSIIKKEAFMLLTMGYNLAHMKQGKLLFKVSEAIHDGWISLSETEGTIVIQVLTKDQTVLSQSELVNSSIKETLEFLLKKQITTHSLVLLECK